MVPPCGRWLCVTVYRVADIPMYTDGDPQAVGARVSIREEAKPRSAAVEICAVFKQYMPPAGGVCSIDPSREGNGMRGAEVDGWNARVLRASVARNRASDLARHPCDTIDERCIVAIPRRVDCGCARAVIKSPPSHRCLGEDAGRCSRSEERRVG